MPSFRQIEYLVALDDVRHFRRAAEKIGVSQPTLSAQIKTLEERLGAPLVERSRSGVIFTALGDRILSNARRILAEVTEIREAAQSYGKEFSGTICLGLPPTIGPYLLPRVLPALHQAYPALRLYVREEIPQSLPKALHDGRFDALIMPVPVAGKDFASIPIFREPLYIAMAADSALAGKSEIDRRDLAGQSILTLEAGHQLHEQTEAICREFGAQLQSDFEGTSLDTLRQMVGLGMGLSFLPGLYVKSILEKDSNIIVRPIKARALFRTIGLIWRRSSPMGDQHKILADHINQTVKREFPDFVLL